MALFLNICIDLLTNSFSTSLGSKTNVGNLFKATKYKTVSYFFKAAGGLRHILHSCNDHKSGITFKYLHRLRNSIELLWTLFCQRTLSKLSTKLPQPNFPPLNCSFVMHSNRPTSSNASLIAVIRKEMSREKYFLFVIRGVGLFGKCSKHRLCKSLSDTP